ncbi:unnamed protein product [Arabis nemorensis]|uniref:Uncharacterized protein n=1 Tax=Arabis nemorensis TaxID=586526 RepID=A0A565CCM7_9BRAS|nr:unnamed protein product [Arabis nemorensis]
MLRSARRYLRQDGSVVNRDSLCQWALRSFRRRAEACCSSSVLACSPPVGTARLPPTSFSFGQGILASFRFPAVFYGSAPVLPTQVSLTSASFSTGRSPEGIFPPRTRLRTMGFSSRLRPLSDALACYPAAQLVTSLSLSCGSG